MGPILEPQPQQHPSYQPIFTIDAPPHPHQRATNVQLDIVNEQVLEPTSASWGPHHKRSTMGIRLQLFSTTVCRHAGTGESREYPSTRDQDERGRPRWVHRSIRAVDKGSGVRSCRSPLSKVFY